MLYQNYNRNNSRIIYTISTIVNIANIHILCGDAGGNGPDGYSRSGTIGGNGWILIVYDNNA
jgi:hypothetical protein